MLLTRFYGKILPCYLVICLNYGRILISDGRRLDGRQPEAEDMCSPPANRANSQVNLIQEWSPHGTRANYTCDPGFYLFGDDVRTCQRDGTWTGKAPQCMKKVSYGKSVNCTGQVTCDRTNQEGLQWLVDDKEDTCDPLPATTGQQETFHWTMDLLEEFSGLGAFRFVFHGKSRDIPIVRISLESTNHRETALKPTECTINQNELDLDYKEIIIRPNVPQSARFIHLFIKTRNSMDKTGFCEAEIYSEDAPAVHQCFDANSIDGSEQSREALKSTLTYGTACYTFDGRASNQWTMANQRCIITNDGKLAHGVTSEVKTVLTNFVKARSLVFHYWIGGRTQKQTVPGLKGYKVVWQWNNGESIDRAFWNPSEESSENQCLGFNAPSGILLMYPCHSYTGAICQTAIKGCSSPERNLDVKLEGAHHRTIGASITQSCSEGYTLEGSNNRQCLSTGKWSGSPARCIHNDIIKQKQKMEMAPGALVGVIIAGIVVGLLIILIALTIIIIRRRGSFKKTLHFKKSENGESVETLDSKEELKNAKDKECLTQAPKENYQSVNQEHQDQEN